MGGCVLKLEEGTRRMKELALELEGGTSRKMEKHKPEGNAVLALRGVQHDRARDQKGGLASRRGHMQMRVHSQVHFQLLQGRSREARRCEPEGEALPNRA